LISTGEQSGLPTHIGKKPFKERVNQVRVISAVKQTVSEAQKTLAATPTPTPTPTP
jgi:hypothetical protein